MQIGRCLDGIIYYATKASKATTSTKFRTLGWKVTVRNTSGSTLQTLYFKLSGSYMYQVDSVTKGNYEYNLYALSLYQMKSRMNTRAGKRPCRNDSPDGQRRVSVECVLCRHGRTG